MAAAVLRGVVRRRGGVAVAIVVIAVVLLFFAFLHGSAGIQLLQLCQTNLLLLLINLLLLLQLFIIATAVDLTDDKRWDKGLCDIGLSVQREIVSSFPLTQLSHEQQLSERLNADQLCLEPCLSVGIRQQCEDLAQARQSPILLHSIETRISTTVITIIIVLICLFVVIVGVVADIITIMQHFFHKHLCCTPCTHALGSHEHSLWRDHAGAW